MMIKKLTTLLFIVNVFFQYTTAEEQTDTLNSRIGVFVDYIHKNYSVDFNKIPNIPNCCPLFEKGIGNGFAFGAIYDYPVYDNIFISTRVKYAFSSVEFGKDEPKWFNLIINDKNNAVLGSIEHNILTDFSNIGVEPVIAYTPVKNLFLNLGIFFEFQLLKKYKQYELLKKPDIGTFENYKRTRFEYDGEIP
ncbi:hypothetical protein ACFLSQ_09560, partial [Bacteroidota bacterium]